MTVNRVNIVIVGKVNAGKSTLMNLFTQTNSSIADPVPGTTADAKTCTMELHGLGPIRLFDTAGIDEKGELGNKKHNKTKAAIKEADLVLIMIDPSGDNFSPEVEAIRYSRTLNKQILVIFNLFGKTRDLLELIPQLKNYKSISIKATDKSCRQKLIDFIIDNYDDPNIKTDLLPFIIEDEFYVLNIPMDAETPAKRLLKPQAMVNEHIIRKWAYPTCFRMDLAKARNDDSAVERNRFIKFIDSFNRRPKAIITDSQAIDILSKWTPDDIELTTFSIAMINYYSRGKLSCSHKA